MLSCDVIYAYLNLQGRGYTDLVHGQPAKTYNGPEVYRVGDGSVNSLWKLLDQGHAVGPHQPAGRYVVVPFKGGWIKPHGAMVICNLPQAADEMGRKGLYTQWAVPLVGEPATNPQARDHLISIDQTVRLNFAAINRASDTIASKPLGRDVTDAAGIMNGIIAATYKAQPFSKAYQACPLVQAAIRPPARQPATGKYTSLGATPKRGTGFTKIVDFILRR